MANSNVSAEPVNFDLATGVTIKSLIEESKDKDFFGYYDERYPNLILFSIRISVIVLMIFINLTFILNILCRKSLRLNQSNWIPVSTAISMMLTLIGVMIVIITYDRIMKSLSFSLQLCEGFGVLFNCFHRLVPLLLIANMFENAHAMSLSNASSYLGRMEKKTVLLVISMLVVISIVLHVILIYQIGFGIKIIPDGSLNRIPICIVGGDHYIQVSTIYDVTVEIGLLVNVITYLFFYNDCNYLCVIGLSHFALTLPWIVAKFMDIPDKYEEILSYWTFYISVSSNGLIPFLWMLFNMSYFESILNFLKWICCREATNVEREHLLDS